MNGDKKDPDETVEQHTLESPFDDIYLISTQDNPESQRQLYQGARDSSIPEASPVAKYDNAEKSSLKKGSDEALVRDVSVSAGEIFDDASEINVKEGKKNKDFLKKLHLNDLGARFAKSTNTDKLAKTLGNSKGAKWVRKNLHIPLPFEDLNEKSNQFDDSGFVNRAQEFRTIYYNIPLPKDMLDEDGHPITEYPRNKIRTTKYTPISFFPKNLYFQFENFANIYFLVLIILGAFPIFGVTSPGFAAVPLIVIVIITALKDAFEDSKRTVLDLEVNNTSIHILDGVKNPNVSSTNISLWRRFKKANTRILFAFIYWVIVQVKKRDKSNQQSGKVFAQGAKLPRTSLDSIESLKVSAEFARNSLEFNQEGQDSDNIVAIDRSMQTDEKTKFGKDYWKNVKVGDIIRIHSDEEIPADVILLSTSDPESVCYVETKNLDGETNLKIRQSLKSTRHIKSSKDIARTKFWLESEGPHANLYSYQGNFKWIDDTTNQTKNEPVTINEMLLRGCTVRNTKWAMCLVVFTGGDSKIIMNSGATPTKRSRISKDLNLSVLINFVLLFIICFVSGIVNGVYYGDAPKSRDFFEWGTIADTPGANGVVTFFVAVILYQNLVPISLYISIEIIKTCQAIFIYCDVLLYNKRLDYPCTPKTWNISDDLGQIEYIFSDKTGTLTQNVMEFKKCTINGISYGRAYTEALAGLRKRQGVDVEAEGQKEREEIAEDKQIMINEIKSGPMNSQFFEENLTFVSKEFVRDIHGENGEFQQKACEQFMLTLALCHSVLVEESNDNPDKLEIKAQSPDEAALVGAARDVGYSFIGKTKQGYIVEMKGVQREFKLLNTLEFNSTRKRMSTIIMIPGETPEDEPKALLLCKGADSIIYSRLKQDSNANSEEMLEKTALHLEQYATEGLRTLCLAQRELSWQEYIDWNEKFDEAAASLTNREEELERVMDEIERDLVLLGGTAIEDRLQDGVPDSIEMLSQAGIKLWVLTGDKVETAINIGFSCNLLHNDMELLIIKCEGDDVAEYGSTPKEIVNRLVEKYLHEKFSMQGSEEELKEAKNIHDIPHGDYGVVIDGEALKIALNDEVIKRKFLLLCKNCKAVLCCRVSPAQKAAVVKLVKNTLDVMTLAIGDGSNDVAMIQSADIGVGIAGEEGRQAVMCSDFAIGQFRYLTRLVLVHGKWSYKRIAEMVPCFFYKNVIFTMANFWYGINSDFDGAYYFEYTFLTFYNLAFTSLPVIFLGILDQDVSDVVSLLFPQLYRVGILRLEWNQTKFLWYMLDGCYQSVIVYYFPYLVYYKNMYVTNTGLGLDHRYHVGLMACGVCVVACNLYVLMEQYRWDWFTSFFIFISLIFYFGWAGLWTTSIMSMDFFKGGARMFGSPVFWGVLFIGTMFCLIPRYTFDVYRKMFYPTDLDIVREMWSRGDFDHYPKDFDPTDPEREKVNKPLLVSSPEYLNSYNNGYSSSGTDHIPLEDLSTKEESPAAYSPNDELHSLVPKNNFLSAHNSHNGRTSLERTRHEMMMNNQIDTRYSVEKAKLSLDLPGLTQAHSLMKMASREN